MQRILLIVVMAIFHSNLFAMQTEEKKDTQQYMLIVRYRTDLKAPDAETVKTNGQHWGEFIQNLAQNGKLVMGLRPTSEGRIIKGKERSILKGVYAENNEVVSSFFVIKATDMEEATEIAKKCPIYELNGSVEIRPVMNTAN